MTALSLQIEVAVFHVKRHKVCTKTTQRLTIWKSAKKKNHKKPLKVVFYKQVQMHCNSVVFAAFTRRRTAAPAENEHPESCTRYLQTSASEK